MKFFTPEWYRAVQLASLGLNFKSCTAAADPRDGDYDRQYEKWVKDQLSYEKKVSKMTFIDQFPAPDPVSMSFLPATEKDAIKKDYEASVDEFKAMFDGREKYDEERLRAEYRKTAEEETERISALLPEEILSMIPDRRFIGISLLPPKAKKKLDRLAKECDSKVKDTLADYDKYYFGIEESLPPCFTNDGFALHDAAVTGYLCEDDSVTLTLDTEYSYSNISRITLSGVTEVNGDPMGAFWLYDELHTDGDNITLGVLMSRDDRVFTFECTFKKAETEVTLRKI